MKTKVMTFSNRNNNLPCGAFAALMFLLLFLVAFLPLSASAQQSPPAPGSRKVIIDQDASGPGGSDMQAILSLVQSPDTDVLGITVVTGDAWLAEEVQHTLRLMEIVGRGRGRARGWKDSIRGQQLRGSVQECRNPGHVSEAWPCG